MARPRVLSLILVNSGVCSLFPHIFLWGSSFWFCIPPPRPPPPPPPPPAPPLTHCHTPSFTHNFVTHHLSHTISHTHTPSFTHHLSHTIFHTQSLSHTHHLSHTIFQTQSLTHIVTHHLSHTIFHIQLCHTPSFTLSHTIFHTHLNFVTHHLSHTTLLPTIFHTHLCQLPAHGCKTGRASTFVSQAIYLRQAWQAWQAWHLVTSTFVLRGRRGTCCTWWRAWAGIGLTPRYFAWQAWHLATRTFVLCGRCRIWWHAPSFCVSGVALVALGGAFGRAWARLGPDWSPVTPRYFAWQAWHLATRTFVLCGRCRIWWHPPSSCMASVACGDMHLRFAWQAWHLLHLVARLGRDWSDAAVLLRGRGGTWRHAPSFCKAGMALGEIHLRFAWQAWQLVTIDLHTIFLTPSHSHDLVRDIQRPSFTHLSHTTLLPTIFHHHHLTATFVTQLCHTQLFHTTLSMSVRGCKRQGRASTFVSQAWHLVTSIFGRRGRSCMWWHPPSFCVVGVAFGDIHLRCPVARIPPPPPPHHLSHTTLSHTIFHHTIFSTQLSHTPSFATPCFTHRFVTPSFTQLCHTLSFHTQLSHTHTPSFTHNFVTHHLSHTTFVTHTHTVFLCHTPSFTYHFVTHNSSHTTCFTSRSSITSFVFPSFPVPTTTFVDHVGRKLTCGASPVLYNFWFSTNFAPGLLQVELPSSNSMQPYSKSRGDQQFNRSI